MVTVRQVLSGKDSEIWTIDPDSTVYDSLILMAEKRIGALLVMSGPELVGIISERDYARKVILRGKSSQKTRVGGIMSKKVYYVSPDYLIRECMALMTDKSVRHLPVLENDRVVGMISIGDVVKAIISDQEFVIEQLEAFIMGW